MTDVKLNPAFFEHPALGAVMAVLVLSAIGIVVFRWRSVNRLRQMGRAAEFGDPPRFLFAKDHLVFRLFAFSRRAKPADRRLFVACFVSEMTFVAALIIGLFVAAAGK